MQSQAGPTPPLPAPSHLLLLFSATDTYLPSPRADFLLWRDCPRSVNTEFLPTQGRSGGHVGCGPGQPSGDAAALGTEDCLEMQQGDQTNAWPCQLSGVGSTWLLRFRTALQGSEECHRPCREEHNAVPPYQVSDGEGGSGKGPHAPPGDTAAEASVPLQLLVDCDLGDGPIFGCRSPLFNQGDSLGGV